MVNWPLFDLEGRRSFPPTGMLPKHISAQMTYATLGLVASVAVLAVGAGAALSAHN